MTVPNTGVFRYAGALFSDAGSVENENMLWYTRKDYLQL